MAKRYTTEQQVQFVKEVDELRKTGMRVKDACIQAKVKESSYLVWKAKFRKPQSKIGKRLEVREKLARNGFKITKLDIPMDQPMVGKMTAFALTGTPKQLSELMREFQ